MTRLCGADDLFHDELRIGRPPPPAAPRPPPAPQVARSTSRPSPKKSRSIASRHNVISGDYLHYLWEARPDACRIGIGIGDWRSRQQAIGNRCWRNQWLHRQPKVIGLYLWANSISLSVTNESSSCGLRISLSLLSLYNVTNPYGRWEIQIHNIYRGIWPAEARGRRPNSIAYCCIWLYLKRVLVLVFC